MCFAVHLCTMQVVHVVDVTFISYLRYVNGKLFVLNAKGNSFVYVTACAARLFFTHLVG